MNLGITQQDRKDFAKARENLETSLGIAQALRYDMFEPVVRYRLAALSLEEGRYPMALAYLDEPSLEKLEKLVTKTFLFDALLVRAQAAAHADLRGISLAALTHAQSLVPVVGAAQNEAAYRQTAAGVHALFGNMGLAYEHLSAAREATKRLHGWPRRSIANELRVRFDAELKQRDNALLRVHQQEAHTRWLAVTLGLALAIVLLCSTTYFLRRRAVAAKREAEHQAALAAAAAAAGEAKDAFLANMSHEMRSPLNAMLGFTSLLLRDPAVASRHDDLAIIHRSGQHLHELINQVLDMSKIEKGRMTLEEGDVQLHDMLGELNAMFAEQARAKGLALSFVPDAGLPRSVRIDGLKLRQVLINLLSNALKFTREGGVELKVSAASSKLRFVVTDTGVGIDADEITKLGDAFVRARAGRQSAEGTGLGLAISRSFVELMGGSLQLESQPGRGTCASFEVPVLVVEPEKLPAVPPGTPRGRTAPFPSGTPPPRILVADDIADGRLLVKRSLSPAGFDVREAADGQQVLSEWQQWRPDLILMDMRMPVMDGREATRRIRARDDGRSVVIIALTADSLGAERDAVLAAGCDDYLSKPFNDDELIQTVARHLGVALECDEVVLGAGAKVGVPTLPTFLHPELRESLLQALERLDVAAIDEAPHEVEAVDPALAEALRPLVQRFDYARAAAWLQHADPALPPRAVA